MSDDLARVQRWMQAVIMHPGGVASGIESAAATQQLDVTLEQVEAVITRSQALSSIERLEIYSRAYYARLLECLQSQFPILTKALGADVFDQFALGYLERYPSQSYTLGLLGSNFVKYLNETRPGDEWSEGLIDLARLEFEFDQVFDGPGVEDTTLLSAADLLAVSGDRWPDAKLILAPCLRLLELKYPVHEYYRNLRRNEEAPFPPPRATWLAITRRDYVVRFHSITRPQFVMLQAFQRGAAIGEAIERVVADGGDLEQLAADLRAWFQTWTTESFFLRIELA